MAEPGRRRSVTNQYFCHSCDVEVEPIRVQEELECPQCKRGFVEVLEVPSTSSSTAARNRQASPAASSSSDQRSQQQDERVDARSRSQGQSSDSGRPRPTTGQERQARGGLQRGSVLDHNYYRSRDGEGTHVLSTLQGPVEFPAALGGMFAHLPVSSHMQPNGEQVFVHGQHTGFGAAGPVHPMAALMTSVFHRGFPLPQAMPFGHGGRMGDYVLGQSGLDAVISQLMESMDGGRPVAVSDDVIEKLPRVSITKEQRDEHASCSVCWDEFDQSVTAVQLPCLHLYHTDCIVPWLKQHDTCPVCRKTVEASSQPTGEATPAGAAGAVGASSSSSSGRDVNSSETSRSSSTVDASTPVQSSAGPNPQPTTDTDAAGSVD